MVEDALFCLLLDVARRTSTFWAAYMAGAFPLRMAGVPALLLTGASNIMLDRIFGL